MTVAEPPNADVRQFWERGASADHLPWARSGWPRAISRFVPADWGWFILLRART